MKQVLFAMITTSNEFLLSSGFIARKSRFYRLKPNDDEEDFNYLSADTKKRGHLIKMFSDDHTSYNEKIGEMSCTEKSWENRESSIKNFLRSDDGNCKDSFISEI